MSASPEPQYPSPHRTPSRLLGPEYAGALLALVCGVCVAAFALWYVSAGKFPAFPNIQNDYIALGRSFLHGELSLQDEPDPRLAELGNPYEYSQRKGIPYHWDASYFRGRYYLYWGPVPGLVSAVMQALGGSPPSASAFVVLPYIGLVAASAVLLHHIARSFGRFAHLTVWVFLLVGFFSLPMLYTIGQPRHYQASIVYGQFFLVASVLAFVLYSRSARSAWLVVCGLALGLAFACRYNLVLSVIIYLALITFWLWRSERGSLWRGLGLLALPLALCLLAMGWYNLARFGDPLETGLAYQLTIPEFGQIDYSTAYIRSGLYIYLAYPLIASGAFPFIQTTHFQPGLLPAWLYVPPGRQFDQIVFGLLPTVPAFWLSALGFPLLVKRLFRGASAQRPGPGGASAAFVFVMLLAGAAAQFAFLLVFFYVAERYIVDFYVPVVLCVAVLVWCTHAALKGRPAIQTILWAAVFALTLWTAAIAYFACFGVPSLVSHYFDPPMVAEAAAFWDAAYASLKAP